MEKEASLNYIKAHVSNVEDIVVDAYDIFLAHDLEDLKRLEKKTAFYDAIGAACERLGFKPFIPYRFLKSELFGTLSFRDTYALLHDIMIPKTRLFICDLTPLSLSIKEMKYTALKLNKPQIYFYERGVEPARSYVELIKKDNPNIRDIIDYARVSEAIRRLENAIKHNMPS